MDVAKLAIPTSYYRKYLSLTITATHNDKNTCSTEANNSSILLKESINPRNHEWTKSLAIVVASSLLFIPDQLIPNNHQYIMINAILFKHKYNVVVENLNDI